MLVVFFGGIELARGDYFGLDGLPERLALFQGGFRLGMIGAYPEHFGELVSRRQAQDQASVRHSLHTRSSPRTIATA